jgi:hypothetical protein
MIEITEEEYKKLKEAECNESTLVHINQVRKFLRMCGHDLVERGEYHDQSKLREPELSTFVEFTPKLKHSTFGSDEYKGFLKEMKVALEHHYAHNRHHPEHFRDGINDMTLIDLVEMLCDWKASSMRHNDGNILKSIDINAERFGISPQLARILRNTLSLFETPRP